MALSGYADRTDPYEEVLSPLYAKVLALEDESGHRALLVTADLLGFQAWFAEPMCQRIMERTGLGRDQILLNASHTHTGPLLNLDPRFGLSPEGATNVVRYIERLQAAVTELAGKALENMQPANLSHGVGAAGFVTNRRAPTPDGIRLLPNPGGPVDRSVPVLRVAAEEGRVLAVVFGCACHNTTLGSRKVVCGDYAGYAQQFVEAAFEGAQAMFVTGCGGDANPDPRGSNDGAEQHGRALGTEVSRVLKGPLEKVTGPLRTGLERVDLPLEAPPPVAELERLARSGPGHVRYTAQQMLRLQESGQAIPRQHQVPIALWQFGQDLTLVGLPGEPVMDYVALLERALGPLRLWVAGYCNDNFGYLASARVLREGGYETRGVIYGGTGVFAPEAETRVVQAVERLARGAGRTLPPPDQPPLVGRIERQILWNGRQGGTTWFHPRPALLPAPNQNGTPVVLMTLQEITGSDVFGQVHWSRSDDLGRTWTDPAPIHAFRRRDIGDGLQMGVCDVVPQFHPPSGQLLAMGHNVYYRENKLAQPSTDRYPVYATYSPDTGWSEEQALQWEDPRASALFTCGCGERLVLDNGDILVPISFAPTGRVDRSVTTLRCGFDGERLTVREAGTELRLPVRRGLLEPSLARFGDHFVMTIRAEDDHGYVSVSEDGLHWRDRQPWRWDDGSDVTLSTTQQHWLVHPDGLFLVYTRKDDANRNVFRWRAPLYLARVNTETWNLMRATERVVLPLIGDGVGDASHVARMGNFHTLAVTSDESWVTVGEVMPNDNWRGDLWLARVRWTSGWGNE